MSTSVNPNGALVSHNDATQYTIVSSTATSPIVITLNAAALTGVGDYVEVTGHLVNTGANGKWQVTNVSGGGTQITLGGTTGTLAGGATGYMRDFSVNPQITIPSTGDAATAASVGTPMSAQIATAIPWLLQRTGNWRTHLIQEIALYAPSTPAAFANSWMTLAPSTAQQSFASPFPLSITDVPASESVFVEVEVQCVVTVTATATGYLYPIISNASGPALYDQAHGYLLGASTMAATSPIVLRAAGLVGSASTPGLSINWVIGTTAGGAGTIGIQFLGACTASVKVYRQ